MRRRCKVHAIMMADDASTASTTGHENTSAKSLLSQSSGTWINGCNKSGKTLISEQIIAPKQMHTFEAIDCCDSSAAPIVVDLGADRAVDCEKSGSSAIIDKRLSVDRTVGVEKIVQFPANSLMNEAADEIPTRLIATVGPSGIATDFTEIVDLPPATSALPVLCSKSRFSPSLIENSDVKILQKSECAAALQPSTSTAATRGDLDHFLSMDSDNRHWQQIYDRMNDDGHLNCDEEVDENDDLKIHPIKPGKLFTKQYSIGSDQAPFIIQRLPSDEILYQVKPKKPKMVGKYLIGDALGEG